ncbi:MAG: ABC transporter ATP-binding protein [Anaerolineae bacterium]|nr:ABC transporter ATP-binding protein [Anaerolineae bacterium]
MNIPLKRYWNLLVQYLKPQWSAVLLLALLLLGSIGLQLLNPQILRSFIDAVVEGREVRALIGKAVLFLGIAVTTQAVSLGVTYLGETIAWKATNALRLNLTTHCLRLDMAFHKARTPGELIERIDGDTGMLAGFFSEMALQLLANSLLALGIVVLLFVEDWRAGTIGVGYSLLTALALRAVRQPLTRAWTDSRQAEADLLGFFGEQISGTEDIRSNGAEPYVMRQLFVLMRRITQRWVKAKLIQGISHDAVWLVTLLAKVAALAVGAWLFFNGHATVGTVYLIFGYIGQMEGPLSTIQHRISDLQRASAGIARVEEVLHTKPAVIEHHQPIRDLPRGPATVAVENVSFQYNDVSNESCGRSPDRATSVLHDISFDLAPGQVLGVLGRTGSGKTTLSRLLFRLYAPDQGTIRIHGIDARNMALGTLRQRVGLVTQDVQVFRATVRDNLTLFKPGLSDSQLYETLHTLGLGTWFESLPHGLDTILETGSQGLSAGQAQMLALARIFLRNPDLVILDEAASRLDPATEGMIERAVDLLLADRTAIIIAHRLSTVQRADAILILEGGQVAEYGPRAALSADPHSRFSGLLRTGLEEALA